MATLMTCLFTFLSLASLEIDLSGWASTNLFRPAKNWGGANFVTLGVVLLPFGVPTLFKSLYDVVDSRFWVL